MPDWVVKQFTEKLLREHEETPDIVQLGKDESFDPNDESRPICNGTLISRTQYLTDIHKWKYKDARLQYMKQKDIDEWTLAIEDIEKYDQSLISSLKKDTS